MAYSALVSLSQILDQVRDGDQHQIKYLHEKLDFLQSFLEDYAYNSGEKVDPLEGRIRDAAYQAADIIEQYMSNQVTLEYKVGFQYLQRRKLKKRCHRDLQKVIQEMDSIVEEALEIKKSSIFEDPAPSSSLGADPSRQAPSSGNTMVGFDEDLMKLKDRLCGETNKLQIISIVGMGGIGKTTLARTTFDDSLAAYHFDIRAWVTISQEYCMRDIFLGLLLSLDATNTNLSDELLAEHVYKSLKGRRYLIVMDDMWSTKAWDDLRRILPDDNNGSRIIITSRLSEVAIYADSYCPPHQVQLLDRSQSWSLLQEKVFLAQEQCPVELERLGKMIAEKCGGLPLAIVLVAGLVSKIDKTLNHWEKFELNVSSTLATDDDHLFKIFSLSYNNLPHHLRACFLYMGGFPEDSQIPISKLMKLWTAEGFLKPVEFKSLEEVAEEYVEDLAKTNLISITRKRFNDKSRICSIHDLLRDFCIQKAHEENFLRVKRNGSTSQESIQNNRRLFILNMHSIRSRASDFLVRSVLFDKHRHYSMSYVTECKLLRVLDGPKVHLQSFPTEITQLFHLRYLTFSYSSRFSTPFVIPTSISKLQNLETLIVTSDYVKCPRLNTLGSEISLPSGIWNMPKLRHLILQNCCYLPLPSRWLPVGKTHILQNLQTLCKVTNFRFTKENIKMIPNLKKMGIVYYYHEFVVNPTKAAWSRMCGLNNLPLLHQLESLNLCFPFESLSEHSDFIQNFALPLKLKKLTLTGTNLCWRDLSSIVGRLPNLEILKLREKSVMGREWESIEGEFQQLKLLLMEGLNIECWRTEHTHFPRLEHLIIRECWMLEEIPCEIGEILSLQSMEVVNLGKSATDSVSQIQEEQECNGNDSLRVHIRCETPSRIRFDLMYHDLDIMAFQLVPKKLLHN